MANVIRQDVVQILFDANWEVLTKISKECSELRKKLSGGIGDDAFEDLKDEATNARKPIKNVKDEAVKLGRELTNIGRKASVFAYNGLKKVASISFKSLIVGAGAAVVGVTKFSQMASDLEETKNKIDVAFGSGLGNFDGAAKSVMDWSKTSTTAMGLAQQSALDLAALFGDMGTSMGLTKDEAAKLSMSLTQQAADLASFKNMNIEEVTTALNGVFTGETESLKQLGVVMTEANLEQYALTKGITKSYKAMTQAEKVQLRYNYVMEMTRNATGDYARTGGGFANQLRTLKENFKQLGAAMGALPMKNLAKGMGVINDALADVQKILEDGFQEEDAEKIMKIVDGLIEKGIKALTENAPQLLSGVLRVLDTIAKSLVKAIPKLAPQLARSIAQMMGGFAKIIVGNAPKLFKAAKDVAIELARGLYEGFTGKTLPTNAFNKLSGAVDKLGNAMKALTPIVISLVAAFKGLKAIRSISALFGTLKGGGSGKSKSGGAFGGITNTLTQFAKTKPKVILQGMANLSIILGGLTVLLLIISQLFKNGIDVKKMVSVIAMIGALGAVGAALSKFGGIAGKIPVSSVAKGLANMAIIIAGMSALFLLLGAASLIDFDLKKITKIIAIIGLLGLVGSALTILGGIVGLIPVSVVALGLANIAIIVAGMSALFLLIGAASLINFDLKQITRIVAIIALLGTVGSILSVFAGIVGLIPVPIVVMGLASIAIIIGGLTAIVVAFGALSKIPGFHDFLERGGQVLVKLFQILGEMVGSLVGGALEGVTNSLPKVGENLTAFANALRPAITMFSGVDLSGVSGFFKAFGAFLLAIGGKGLLDSIGSLFGGDSSLASIGTELSLFAQNSQGFFAAVAQVPEASFEKIKLLFEALSHIGQLPGFGGLKQVFMGDPYQAMQQMIGLLPKLSPAVNQFYAGLGERTDFSALPALFDALASVKELPSHGGVAQFFTGDPYSAMKTMITMLPGLGTALTQFYAGLGERTDFTALPTLFNALASVKELPSHGGVAQFFTGDPYEALKSMISILPELGGSVSSFFASIGSRTDFSAIPALFEALGSLGDHIGAEGGLFGRAKDFFAGDSKAGLTQLGNALKAFGENTKEFFSQVNNLNLGNLNGLWESLKKPGEITTNSLSMVDKNISGIVEKVKQLPRKMAAAIKSGASAFASAFVYMWTQALNVSNTYTRRIISSVKRAFSQITSVKQAVSAIGYANGTNGHPGGNAVVNDGRGAELVQMPNGNTFIPQGHNVLLPNAPRGMRVLSAGDTAALMGKPAPTFHYAAGTASLAAYTPESSAPVTGTTNVRGGDVYSPVFNLTISGSGDDRATERKVKRWIKEALDETFDGMARRNPRLREV